MTYACYVKSAIDFYDNNPLAYKPQPFSPLVGRPDLGVISEVVEVEILAGADHLRAIPGTEPVRYEMNPDNPGEYALRTTIREVSYSLDGQNKNTYRIGYIDEDGVQQYEYFEKVQTTLLVKNFPRSDITTPCISGPTEIVAFSNFYIRSVAWTARGFFGLFDQFPLFGNSDFAGRNFFDYTEKRGNDAFITIPGNVKYDGFLGSGKDYTYPPPAIYDFNQRLTDIGDRGGFSQTMRFILRDREDPYSTPTLPVIPPGGGGVKPDKPYEPTLLVAPQYVISVDCVYPCQAIGAPHLYPLVEVKE